MSGCAASFPGCSWDSSQWAPPPASLSAWPTSPARLRPSGWPTCWPPRPRPAPARFTFSLVLTHSNSAAWTEVRGSGLVAFKSGDMTATEHVPGSAVTTRTITIRHSEYVELDAVLRSHWVKLPLPREPQSSLGLADPLGTVVPISGLNGYEPVVAVRDMGPAAIGGIETTRYLVSTAVPPLCPGQHKDSPTLTAKQLPTTVWLERSGRIVQVRSRVQRPTGLCPPGRILRLATLPRGSGSTPSPRCASRASVSR